MRVDKEVFSTEAVSRVHYEKTPSAVCENAHKRARHDANH